MNLNGLHSVVCNFYILFSTGRGRARDYVSRRLNTEGLELISLVALAIWFSGLEGSFPGMGVGCRVSSLGYRVWKGKPRTAEPRAVLAFMGRLCAVGT